MMRLEDLLDSYDPKEDEDEYIRSGPGRVICKRCGEQGLHWCGDSKGWYLADERGYIHECDDNRLRAKTADDFEVIDE